MANLKELCSNIPQSIIRTATDCELARRKALANKRKAKEYEKRMQQLDMEKCIFEQCKRNRTQKRVRNTWSSEQAGRVGMVTIDRRFDGSRIHVVCKSYSNRY